MKKNRILAVALSAGLVLAGGLTPVLAAEQPAETAQDVENNEVGYKTKENAEKAAQAALDAQEEGKKINKSFTVNQAANGKYMYMLSPVESEKPEQPAPEVEEKAENNDNGYKSEEAAQKAGEKDLKDKKLEESYQVEVRKEASLNKDNDKEARYFYRFVLKEEDKKPEDKKPEDKKPEDKKPEVKPTPDYTPAKPEDKTPAAPAENDKEVDQLIKDLNDSQKKINDLLEQNEKENAELNKKDKKEKDKKEADKKDKKKQAPAKKGNNPKTGVVGLGSVASLAAISMAGIVATRKRK